MVILISILRKYRFSFSDNRLWFRIVQWILCAMEGVERKVTLKHQLNTIYSTQNSLKIINIQNLLYQ